MWRFAQVLGVQPHFNKARSKPHFTCSIPRHKVALKELFDKLDYKPFSLVLFHPLFNMIFTSE
jgi:hypothetical protein